MFNKFRIDSDESKRLAKEPMTAAGALLLLKFMLNMNKNNIIKGSPEELIKSLGVSPWEFRHGVKALKDRDFIRKYTKWEYMINPELIYNGDDRHHYMVSSMWHLQTLGRGNTDE